MLPLQEMLKATRKRFITWCHQLQLLMLFLLTKYIFTLVFKIIASCLHLSYSVETQTKKAVLHLTGFLLTLTVESGSKLLRLRN